MGMMSPGRIWRRQAVLGRVSLATLVNMLNRQRFGFRVKSFHVAALADGKSLVDFTIEKNDFRIGVAEWETDKARWFVRHFQVYAKLPWCDVLRVLRMLWKSKPGGITVCRKSDAGDFPRKTFIVRGDGVITDLAVLSHPKLPKFDEPLTDSISSLRCVSKTATVSLHDPCVWTVVCEYRAVDNEEPPCP